MAGISLFLENLARKEDSAGIFQGYPHSFFIAIGPWLMALFWLGSAYVLSTPFMDNEAVPRLRQVLLYNLSFSLVLSGPVLLVINRYLGYLIRARELDKASDLFMGALAITVLTQIPLVGIYYGFVVKLPGLFRLAACINYFVLATLWLLMVFLPAVRAYRLSAWTCFFGGIISLISMEYYADQESTAGMLMGFSMGVLLIVFTLLAHLMAEHRQRSTPPMAYLHYLRRYWDLALGGLGFFLMIWVDKWIMWFAPEAESIVGNMPGFPAYDTALGLAALTGLPALISFLVHLETNFNDKYLRFYRAIRRHGHYANIHQVHAIIVRTMKRGIRTIGILQVTLSLGALVAAPEIFEMLQLKQSMVGMFQVGVAGCMFHVFSALAIVYLWLFDYRRPACFLALGMALTNALLTSASLLLGPRFYGFGFLLSALLGFIVAIILLLRGMRILPYHTFVVSNESV